MRRIRMLTLTSSLMLATGCQFTIGQPAPPPVPAPSEKPATPAPTQPSGAPPGGDAGKASGGTGADGGTTGATKVEDERATFDPTGTMRGQIENEDGTAYVGGHVTLDRRASEGLTGALMDMTYVVVRGTAAGASLGASELKHFGDGKTNAEGAYGWGISVGQSTDHQAYDVVAAKENGQTVSQVIPRLTTEKLVLPTMRFWDGVKAPASGAHVSGEVALEVSPPAESPRSYTAIVAQQEGGKVHWHQTVETAPHGFPGYLFSTGGSFTMRVLAHLEGYAAGAAPRAFTHAGAGESSLLAPANVSSGGGTAIAGLHDGNTVDAVKLPGKPFVGFVPDDVVIDLGAEKTLGRLIGFGGQEALASPSYQTPLSVYLSADKESWGEPVGTVADKWFDLDLKDRKARYIKIGASSEAALAELRIVGR